MEQMIIKARTSRLRHSTLTVLILICWSISLVASVEKADHLKGKSNFKPGSCTSQTCVINSKLNGWFTHLAGYSMDEQPYRIETNKKLFGIDGPDYWVYLTNMNPQKYIYGLSMGNLLSFPQEAQFQIVFDYFIPSSEYSVNEVLGVYVFKSKSQDKATENRISTYLQQFYQNLKSNEKTTFRLSRTFKPHPFIFFYVADIDWNQKGIRVTNIHFYQTCDVDQMVITLIDGTERCGDTATLSPHANADFFDYARGSYTDFVFHSCDPNGLTPVLVSLGTIKGCAQKNPPPGVTYKKTQISLGNVKFYLIPTDCEIINNIILCPKSQGICLAYRLDGSCSSCNVGYISSADFKSCYRKIQNCELYNALGECTRCISGFILEKGGCLNNVLNVSNASSVPTSQIKCETNQYLNSDGICVLGNVKFCKSYLSPSGQCQVCETGYSLNILKQCAITCPIPPSKLKYVIIQGKCIAVDINCKQNNSDGTCAVCYQSFYLFRGKCYKVL